MWKCACAILAVFATLAQVRAQTLDRPLPVKFELADGVRVEGTMTKWDADGFDGSFGRREWIDLMPDDVWQLHHKLLKQPTAVQWINLGRVLLLMRMESPKANELADRAFRLALREDASVEPDIEQVRQQADQTVRARREAERQRAARQLNTHSPEAKDWPANPWPQLNDDEWPAAILTMRTEAAKRLDHIGQSLVPVETEHYLVYSQTPRAEAAKWAVMLERVHEHLRKQLDASKSTQLEWGKTAVFIFTERPIFEKMEEEVFAQLVPLAIPGVAHYTGPQVFINMHRDVDEDEFAVALIDEAVHGLMHYYLTPKRLPAWANEGLAEVIASKELPQSLALKERRDAALAFIRDGGDINAVLDLSYEQITTVKLRDVHRGIGMLMTELMIRERPQKYIQWVTAVKSGQDWQPALKEEYGVSRAALVDVFTRYYKVND
jgi:hypothetical protein